MSVPDASRLCALTLASDLDHDHDQPTSKPDSEPCKNGKDVTDESKTPTRDMPNPPEAPQVAPRLKAELKPLQEELRKIDSLSVRFDWI